MRPSIAPQGMACDSELPAGHLAIIPSRLRRRNNETPETSARTKRIVRPIEVSVTALQDVRKRFEPQLRRIFHLYWRIARGMTLGVRGLVLDGDNRVFLVKHSYVS